MPSKPFPDPRGSGRTHHKPGDDAAFNHLMSNMLDGAADAVALADEAHNDHDELLLSMYQRFAAAPRTVFVPGQIVRWKNGMKNRKLPAYGEPVIIMEVLNPAVYPPDEDLAGSNYFREPLTLVLGVHDSDGDFLAYHFDGRRFELHPNQGSAS